MLELSFSAQDLALTRFACSPLWEAVASVRVLAAPGAHAAHLPWQRRARARLDRAGLDIGLLAELTRGRTLPGFLAATPATPVPELPDELERLRATPPEQVRAELDGARCSPEVQRLHREPARGLGELAGLVERYWELAIAPEWPRIRALCEGDVHRRARLLADGGADRVFNDLAPGLRWRHDTLALPHAHVSGRRPLAGRGLVLVPSVFAWPRVFSKVDKAWQPVLRYPPRGIATLWEAGPAGAGPFATLAPVIGRSRAVLLAELAVPASTTELARRTGLSAGAVSQQLGVLRAAGLVSGHREGRSVRYARTAAAEGLVAAAG